MVADMVASLKRDCGYGCERGYGAWSQARLRAWLRAWLRALSVVTGVAAGIVAGVVAGLVVGVMRIRRRNFIRVLSLSVPMSCRTQRARCPVRRLAKLSGIDNLP
jgi:hypothetical protein